MKVEIRKANTAGFLRLVEIDETDGEVLGVTGISETEFKEMRHQLVESYGIPLNSDNEKLFDIITALYIVHEDS